MSQGGIDTNTDTETINAILAKLLELINLWVQGASLNLQNQSNSMSKISMYVGIASAISTVVLGDSYCSVCGSNKKDCEK